MDYTRKEETKRIIPKRRSAQLYIMEDTKQITLELEQRTTYQNGPDR